MKNISYVFILLFGPICMGYAQFGAPYRDGVSKGQKEYILKALAQNGFSLSDFEQLEVRNCDQDTESNKYSDGVFGGLVRNFESKDLSIPQGSNIEICNGHINFISSPANKTVRFMNIKCRGGFKPSLNLTDTSNLHQIYECKITDNVVVNKISLPNETEVIFNQKGSLCFTPSESISIAGKRYFKNKLYRITDTGISNLRNADECLKVLR